MATDTKSVVSEIANSALMITPEIPVVGVALTGVLAGGLALFEIFFPDDTDILEDPPVTGADLDDAVSTLEQAFIDDGVKLMINGAETHVMTLETSLGQDWTDATGAVSDPSGQMAADDKLRAQYQAFIAPVKDDYLDFRKAAEKPIVDHDSNLYNAITIFTQYKDYRYLSLPLFLYAVNITILYFKLNVLWDYRIAVSDENQYPQLHDILAAQIKKADKTLLKDTRAWIKNRKQGPNPLEAKIKGEIVVSSPFVSKLTNRLTDPTTGYVGILDEFIQEIENAYASRDKKIAARQAQVTVRQKGQNWEVFDTESSKVVSTQSIKKLAELNAKTYAGTLSAAINKTEITDRNFGEFDDAYLTLLKQIRDHWISINSGALDFITNYQQNAPG